MRKIFNNIFLILIIIIIYSGSSSIRHYSNFALVLLPIITLLTQLGNGGKLAITIKDISMKLAIILLIYFIISLIYTYDKTSTIEYIIKFSCVILTISCSNFDKYFWKKFIQIIYISSLVVSITIFITIINKNFFFTYFSFLLPTGLDSYKMYIYELNNNIFSGILFERAFAAFVLNLGIIAIISEYFSENKISKFKFISLILIIIALCCTGKRMLFLIFVIILFMFVILNWNKKYLAKYIKLLPVIILFLISIFAFFPNTTKVFERFSDNSVNTIDTRNNDFWKYTFDMFKSRPIYGYGINSFIPYILSFRSDSIYNAHNIYFQLLGETGIIGFLLFLSLEFSNVIFTLNLLKKCNEKSIKTILNFSLAVQILFILYGITGNTLYEFSQITIYLLTIAINSNIRKEISYEKENRNNNIS